nr:glycosyltransferase family 4 protein [Cohnella zeiphila]
MFLAGVSSPQRIAFFNRLGTFCELTVWFQSRGEPKREERGEEPGALFRCRFLSGSADGRGNRLNLSVLRALEQEPFDVYVLGSCSSPTEMLAIQWLKLRRKRFILNAEGTFVSDVSRVRRKLKRYWVSGADLWLSSGRSCTRYLQENGADPERILEYPLALNRFGGQELAPLTEEERGALRRREGLQGTVFLSIGPFLPRNGVDVLLDAFGRLSAAGASLLLIGDGPEREKYERTVRDRGIRHVVIKTYLPKRELLRYWKVADVFALPAREETWGSALNEAIGFGLPIVSTTKAGAALDLVRDGTNGFLVPPDNAAMLAERLGKLAGDPELRGRFGAESRKLSEQYSIERMVEEHVRALEQFVRDAERKPESISAPLGLDGPSAIPKAEPGQELEQAGMRRTEGV